MHYSNLSQILHLLRLSNNSTNINIQLAPWNNPSLPEDIEKYLSIKSAPNLDNEFLK